MVCFVSVYSVTSILLISVTIMATEEGGGGLKNECNTLVHFVWQFIQDYRNQGRLEEGTGLCGRKPSTGSLVEQKGSQKHKLKKIKKSCGFYNYWLFLPFALSCVVVCFIFLFGKCRH